MRAANTELKRTNDIATTPSLTLPSALAPASRPASEWRDATLLEAGGVAHGGISLQVCIANAKLNHERHCRNAIAHFALRPRPPRLLLPHTVQTDTRQKAETCCIASSWA